MSNTKINVGDTLYCERSKLPQPVIVEKVGRAYLYLQNDSRKFNIETLTYKSDYTQEKLYRNGQDIIEKNENERLRSKFCNIFGNYHNTRKFTLDQMKRIDAILSE